jgi:radical SAM superfamily enzyme YgiQ (UPF0313 family)
MKVLLVSPEFPITYWGFQYSMSLTGKRANLPPLGLISLAALLPTDWDLHLVDLNVARLKDKQIRWADAVFVGGMRIQAASIHQVVARAKRLGKRTVVGGAAPTTAPEEFGDADAVFVGEAEGRIDELVRYLERPAPGHCQLLPQTSKRPAMETVPVPRFDLLEIKRYSSISLQYSRGCPFSCEFCDIVEIFGRVPRLKAPKQVIAELDEIHRLGFGGSVFFVDDNFIGNKRAASRLLEEIATWQEARGYPFELFTEASVDLASSPTLVDAMVRAGFAAVFLGIETPSTDALAKAGKRQNLRLDQAAAVEKITAAGLEVMGGFIVGFDQDDADTFTAQKGFIEPAPIPLAMVGLLMALPGTALSRRLEREGRLRRDASGDQFGRPNFEPVMDEGALLEEYARLLGDLYSPEAYYRRCEAYVDRAARAPGRKRVNLWHLIIFARAVIKIGIFSRWRRHFWRLVGRAIRRAPHTLAWAVGHAVMGEHMIRYTANHVLPRIERALADLRSSLPALPAAIPPIWPTADMVVSSPVGSGEIDNAR